MYYVLSLDKINLNIYKNIKMLLKKGLQIVIIDKKQKTPTNRGLIY